MRLTFRYVATKELHNIEKKNIFLIICIIKPKIMSPFYKKIKNTYKFCNLRINKQPVLIGKAFWLNSALPSCNGIKKKLKNNVLTHKV